MLAIRLGFLAAGSHLFMIAERFWFATNYLWGIAPVLLSFIALGLAITLLVMGLLSHAPIRYQWLILAALLVTLGADYYLRILASSPQEMGTDSALYSIYSSDLVLSGVNPYTANMRDAYDIYQVSDYYMTPRMSGGTFARMPYPALHFLVFTPIRALGVWDIRALYVLMHAALLVLLFRRAPPELRGLILMPLYTNPRYLEYTYGWVSDIVWVAAAVAMILMWDRPTWRAIFYGLACAYKQSPWFLAPFILIRLLFDEAEDDAKPRLERAAIFFGIAGGIFLLANGPFIAFDYQAWLDGVFEPLLGDYIYFGNGLSSLTQLGFVPLTRSFYSIATLTALAAAVLVYALKFRQLKYALWVMPAIVLWFSYRSLQNYFVYWLPLVLAEVVNLGNRVWPDRETAREADSRSVPAPGRFGWLTRALSAVKRLTLGIREAGWGTYAVIALAFALIVGSGWYTATTTVPLRVEIADLSMNDDLKDIDSMQIAITNTNDRDISPRIAVQRINWQPYGWEIASGPPTLAPGESGTYLIRTDIDYRMFNLAEGAQVVVTDASGDYSLRGTARVRADIYDGPYPPGGLPEDWRSK